MCTRAALGMHSRVSLLYVYKGCARHAFKGEPTYCMCIRAALGMHSRVSLLYVY